jgi:mannosyltransferase OCH1-like enzyme
MTVRPRASRRGLVVFLLFVLTVVATILYRSRLLFGLLLEDGLRTAIYPAELIAELEHEHDSHSDVIPKIIHQTYKNTSLPAIWLEQQNQTLALHEDYEYMVSGRLLLLRLYSTDVG